MRLSPLEAYDTVMRFARDCGEWPLRLAMHASVAQSFRPLFLHLTKLNYLPEAAGDPSVESDVLLAPFCREIGAGYFDFDPRVRALLLDNLQSEYAAEGRSRLRSVAGFLMSYLEAQERSIDSTQDRLSQSYIEVQRWIALSLLDPDGAAQQLAAALNRTGRSDTAVARVQIGGLVNVLAAPLLRYPQLTDYALGVQALERGEVQRAQDLLSGLDDLQVGPVKLRPARAVLAAWNIPEKTVEVEEKPPEKQRKYASCFIGWGRGQETRRFVEQLARELRFAGVDFRVDGEDPSVPVSPLAGRQVLVLVSAARADSTYELSRHADEAASAGMPIVTLSLDRELGVLSTFSAFGKVDFSDGHTPDKQGFRIAFQKLLDLLRDQAGWQPKAQNPWAGRKFKYDVFISDARERGWEDKFQQDLQIRLRQISSVKITSWKDTNRIAIGESWPKSILEDVRDSALFVPLVTPSYRDSEICRYELDEFVKSATQSGGLSFGDRNRILPVFLGQRPSRDLPYALAEVNGMTVPEPGEGGYDAAIDELAHTLRDTLELFHPTSAKSDAQPRQQIYLQVGHSSDVEAALPLVNYLTNQGFSCNAPLLVADSYQPDDRALQECDATIIFWGSASSQWAKTRGAETVKYWLMARRRPLMGVYVGPPANSVKQSFLGFPYFQVLRSLSTVDPAVLGPLIRQLRSTARYNDISR